MHLKSDNVEAMTFDNVNKVIKEIFELLISRNQIGLEISTRDGDFILNGVNLIYYKCHETCSKRGGSCIDSPDWMKKKKTTTNPKNKYDRCFNMQQQCNKLWRN